MTGELVHKDGSHAAEHRKTFILLLFNVLHMDWLSQMHSQCFGGVAGTCLVCAAQALSCS